MVSFNLYSAADRYVSMATVVLLGIEGSLQLPAINFQELSQYAPLLWAWEKAGVNRLVSK